MNIRRAASNDAAELLSMMSAITQPANGFEVAFTNTPDFFSRHRLYDESTVYVAERDGQIAGSASVAIRDCIVGGRPLRVGYEYQYFVDKGFRRSGVARRLRQRIEADLRAAGVDIATAMISSTNVPSAGLFADNAFRSWADLRLVLIQVAEYPEEPARGRTRRAASCDLPAVVELINQTWADYEFHTPLTIDGLLERLAGKPGFSLERLRVVENVAGEIVACAGIWNWSDVQRIEMRPAGQGQHAAPGRSLRQWGLSLNGFRSFDDFAHLLRSVNNLASLYGIEQIGITGSPAVEVASAFPSVTMPLQFLAKPLKSPIAPGPNPIFFDITDV
jgi:GNAT superfamily N-acetyltransferase